VEFHHTSQTCGYGGFSPYKPNKSIWWNFTISATSADMVDSHHISQTGRYSGISPY
jgi:hypothetical protein